MMDLTEVKYARQQLDYKGSERNNAPTRNARLCARRSNENARIAEKLDLGVQIAGLGLGEVDYIEDTIVLDDRAASFFDFPPNEPISRTTLHGKIHPEDRPEVEREVSCLLSPESEGFISVVHRVIDEDGSIRWLSARKQVTFEGVLPNGDPKPVSGLVATQDITEFKESEARVQYLVGEVAHRSKNMLSVVQAIARMTNRTSVPAEFMSSFSARLRGLAANQSILVDDKWTIMTMARLARSQLEPYTSDRQDRIVITGPDVTLNDKAAQGIGMALHELATNAVKYGALSNVDGTIELSWEISGTRDKQFSIQWTEKSGPTVNPPSRKGFGETVIRQMAASSVSGSVNLDYNLKGVAWTLTAPLKNVRPLYAAPLSPIQSNRTGLNSIHARKTTR